MLIIKNYLNNIKNSLSLLKQINKKKTNDSKVKYLGTAVQGKNITSQSFFTMSNIFSFSKMKSIRHKLRARELIWI